LEQGKKRFYLGAVSSLTFMYKLLRSFLFLFPPEAVHHFSMKTFHFLSRIGILKKALASPFSQRGRKNTEFEKCLWGLDFRNPLGLGAGFDKNARYLEALELLGFGFLEIGTVTPLAQKGNEKPRLFRLSRDRALINRMGFNNDGVKVVAERVRQWRRQNNIPSTSKRRMLVGGNIGKNKATPNEEAWKDYEICFLELWDCVDFFVVNLSSPNTPGLRELQEKTALRNILTHLQSLNERESRSRQSRVRPLLLKIAPDLNPAQLDEIIQLAMDIRLDGLVVCNTTLSREGLRTDPSRLRSMSGGLSGLPLRRRSTEMIQYIHGKSAGQIPQVASGGIFSYNDAREKVQSGASLVEIWTGFIYEGPGIVKAVLQAPL
jgi:dihydroorotate dehydrogenase